MPQRSWSKKRERQYEHVKAASKQRGVSEDRAEEIAARTVNKERARTGEARVPASSPGRTATSAVVSSVSIGYEGRRRRVHPVRGGDS